MKFSAKFFGLIFLLTLCSCASPKVMLFPDTRDPLQEFTLEGKGPEKVCIISIDGTISHLPESGFLQNKPNMVQEVVAHLRRAEKDELVRAVLLKIDSPGGSTTASDLLYHEIVKFKERTGKPIIAVMMNVAASGGYYIALPADKIIAHPTTVTGSVGVIFMRPSAIELTQKIGLEVKVSKSGANKDMGSPFRLQTDEEKEIFQAITDQLGQRFLDLVAKHRKMSTKQLQEVATARIFLADRALELGIIDEIGYLSDALTSIKQMASLAPDAKVVVYRRSEFNDDNIYNLATEYTLNSPGSSIQQLWTHLTGPEAGFYYLWSPAY